MNRFRRTRAMVTRRIAMSLACAVWVTLAVQCIAYEAPDTRSEPDTDARVTAHFEQVKLPEAVAQVAAQTGAQVYGRVPGDRQVSVSFDDRPVVEALQRLLSPESFTVTFDPVGRVRGIRVIGDSEPGSVAVQPITVARQETIPDAPDTPATFESDASMSDGSPPPSLADATDLTDQFVDENDPQKYLSAIRDMFGARTRRILLSVAKYGEPDSLRTLAMRALSFL